MDQGAPATGFDRLDNAVRRLEIALANRQPPAEDGELRSRYEALTGQVEAALRGLDQLLGQLA